MSPVLFAPLDLHLILQLSTLKRKAFKHFVQDHPHPPTIYHKLDSEVLVNSCICILSSEQQPVHAAAEQTSTEIA